MGIVLNICVQARQCGIWTKLSAPINQTKCVAGYRVCRASSVSAVNRVPSSASIADTRIRRSQATSFADRNRDSKGAIPASGLSGFCGETSHQTSSSPNRTRANRLI